MKKSLALTGLFIAVVLFSCKPDKMSPGPAVSGFTPTVGKPGDTVTITGNNFSTQPSEDIVALNSSAASVVNATGTTLTVVVPMGATTGKFSVTINGNTGVSANNFTVLPLQAQPPAIGSFTPASGAPGAEVTIIGTGFSAVAANNTVKFSNNITAVITTASTTQLKVKVPQGAATGNISVIVAGTGTAVSATAFTVLAPLAISSFAPAFGLPGDTVVVTGAGFSTLITDNTIRFTNNVMAQVTAVTATQVKVIVPPGAVTGTLSATVAGQSAASTASFEVLADIPRSGLVSWYPFSGNANDASGNGFNLSVYGTYALVPDRFGIPNKAYFFNGGNSYAISTSQTDGSVSQPLTVAAWIKYDSLLSSTIFGKYDVTTGGYLMGLTANGAVMMYQNAPDYVMSNAGVIPINTGGQWIFVAATYDGTTMSFYKNGVLVQSIASANSVTATAGTMRIGLSGDGGTGPAAFKCSIDDVTVYNRVLSVAEVQQLYAQTISKK